VAELSWQPERTLNRKLHQQRNCELNKNIGSFFPSMSKAHTLLLGTTTAISQGPETGLWHTFLPAARAKCLL